MTSGYRKLTEGEISMLEAQGCVCDDWNTVSVGEGFEPRNIRRSVFSGEVRIGACSGTVTDRDGITRPAGIYNSMLINCTVGDNVLITKIGSYIANYDIGDGAIVGDTGKLVCGGSSFGNGVRARVINEGGGREVAIHDGLSAQTAYLMAMYRHHGAMVENLYKLVDDYAASIRSERGTIGAGSRITGCDILRDIRTGEGAVLEGVNKISNATIGSSAEYPTYIGAGVTARNFVCTRGVRIMGGIFLERCFAGEGCRIENGFTAMDSLFFSNSYLGCGEAASVFGGPYTVSHHKSSLLIAGYFLFFNAGSGANQSNHLFKTGAVHQGVHERGCKFGSNAYVVLPAREGAFTVVIGRHKSHHDTADFPYSYLTEEEDKTCLHPGANLRSYGAERDLAKWPKRDLRGLGAADIINFEESNPYVGAKFLRGMAVSRGLLAKKDADTYMWRRLRIKGILLKKGLELYGMALDATVGNILAQGNAVPVEPCAAWVDMAGMYAPQDKVERLCDDIGSGRLGSLEEINRELATIHRAYKDDAYTWALSVLAEALGHEPSAEEIAAAVEKGAQADRALKAMRQEDARRDEAPLMHTSYGIDAADDETIQQDFKAVRNIE